MADLIPLYLNIVAFLCTVGAIALAIFHIYRHLLNYTEPTYQRYIVRIIFMVSVYACMSFLSLVLPKSSLYFNSIREVYEAWVIYNFLSLCLALFYFEKAIKASPNDTQTEEIKEVEGKLEAI